MVLRKEVYVTACLLSGSIYVVLLEFGMGMLPLCLPACSVCCVFAYPRFSCISLPAFHLGKPKETGELQKLSLKKGPSVMTGLFIWWSYAGSNRGPLACHASALPTEL